MSWKLTATELANIVNGTVVSDSLRPASGLSSDTRKDMQGQLFVALKGDSFDAHDYVSQCLAKGAHCALIHTENAESDKLKGQIGVVKVQDTLLALQTLAQWWRRKCNWKVLAITGSSGKTTTKEILKGLVAPHLKVFANEKNYNNHWGVPFTLLATPADVDVLITEMGMSHLGEIQRLCEIAEPNAVVCTMVGQAHIGELGSIEKITEAKEEIYLNSPSATMVFNIDNEKTMEMHFRAVSRGGPQRIYTFSSFNDDADIWIRANDMSLEGLKLKGSILGIEGEAALEIIGRHNTVNVSAAIGMALSVGLAPEQIWQTLDRMPLRNWGRNQLVHLKNGAQVLFDAYNANPESMSALIKNLFEIYTEGKKVAVFGEMLELGHTASENHRKLGEMVGNTDIEMVWFIGPHKTDFEAGLVSTGFKKTYYISDTYEETLALKIGSVIEPTDIVVLKGSRGIKLENVLNAWDPVDFV